ncbi:uncharacterized protein LOC129317207 isoform X2 [Prosopis cineraria]|uniref:uncharacterized protein LOC129317207 isoform X2 n=1 Tax=Prosopis cineraria TaxID=364024 RepID=UPI00240EB9CE|nr:uncharacterized protein LOC129317207 isoform X2 [Prosopis cineraria]
MVSFRGGDKRTAMHRNLQVPRSIINSHQQKRKASSSVILHDSVYLQSLRQTLEELNRAIAASQKLIDYDPVPMLIVEAREEGFMIKVLSQRSCEGLLVFVLEAIEELGLDVLQARVSCVDSFCLEAVIGIQDDKETGHLNAQLIEQAVSQAIQSWKELED